MSSDSQRLKPSFFLIGGQKCGSTFVHRNLSQHPHVFMPRFEIRVLEDVFFKEGGIEAFYQLYSEAEDFQVRGAKSPSFMNFSSEVVPRLLQLNPEAKILAILRNPVERAISDYFHHIRYGHLPPLDIEEGFDRIFHGRMGEYQTMGEDLLHYGLYYKNLGPYRIHFPTSQLNFFFYEQIKRQPQTLINEVLQYLELDNTLLPESGISHVFNRSIYNQHRLKLRAKMLKRKYEYFDSFRHFRPRDTSFSDRFVIECIWWYDKFAKRLLPNPKPQASSQLINRLRDYYEDDLNQLGKWLKTDFSPWLRGKEISIKQMISTS